MDPEDTYYSVYHRHLDKRGLPVMTLWGWVDTLEKAKKMAQKLDSYYIVKHSTQIIERVGIDYWKEK